jgi:hypothetical protein
VAGIRASISAMPSVPKVVSVGSAASAGPAVSASNTAQPTDALFSDRTLLIFSFVTRSNRESR